MTPAFRFIPFLAGILNRNTKRWMHVKADGTCNGTIEEGFTGYRTRFDVFVKEAPRQGGEHLLDRRPGSYLPPEILIRRSVSNCH